MGLFAFNGVAIWIFPRTPSYGASCLTLSHYLYPQLHTTFFKDPEKYTARYLQRYFSTPTVKTFFTSLHKDIRNRDSVVGIAISYGQSGRTSSPGGFKDLLHVVQTGSGVKPTSYPMGTGALSQGVKRPGREADHSPPASSEVKKMWIYTPTPPHAFMV
jgi:hypothetical protein